MQSKGLTRVFSNTTVQNGQKYIKERGEVGRVRGDVTGFTCEDRLAAAERIGSRWWGGLDRDPCGVGARAWVPTGVNGEKEKWTSQETRRVNSKGLSPGLWMPSAREGTETG